jgi:hypothetical protein
MIVVELRGLNCAFWAQGSVFSRRQEGGSRIERITVVINSLFAVCVCNHRQVALIFQCSATRSGAICDWLRFGPFKRFDGVGVCVWHGGL